MAIGTANNAFCDFLFRLFNAFRVADVDRLGRSVKVIKVKGTGVFESTIDAPDICLAFAYPLSNCNSTSVCNAVDSLPVAGILKASSTPSLLLFSSWLRPWRARSVLAKITAELCLTLCEELCTAVGAGKFLLRRVIVGFHDAIITYPCKPDIFDATYEAA